MGGTMLLGEVVAWSSSVRCRFIYDAVNRDFDWLVPSEV